MGVSAEQKKLQDDIIREFEIDLKKMSVDSILAMLKRGEHPVSVTLKRLIAEKETREQ